MQGHFEQGPYTTAQVAFSEAGTMDGDGYEHFDRQVLSS